MLLLRLTAMLDASTTAALVTAVEHHRAATTGAGLLAVGRDSTLLRRWCDRTVYRETVTRGVPAQAHETAR